MMRHFLDAWNDPAMRHAMVIHFPIVLATLGVPVLLAAALLERHRPALRFASVVIYAILALGAFAGRGSGQDAEEAVEASLDDAGEAILEEHEELGIWVWVFGGAVAAIAGAGFSRPRALQVGAAWTAAAGGVFTAAWTANTADHGGRLVYLHGAGTRGALANEPASTEAPAPPGGDPRLAFFNDEVRPILVNNCLRCHNPQRMERSAGLDATRIAGLLAGGESGPAVVPGRPDESLLIRAVRWENPDLKMPRGKDKLPEAQIAVLEKWIAEGAAWAPFDYEIPASTSREPAR